MKILLVLLVTAYAQDDCDDDPAPILISTTVTRKFEAANGNGCPDNSWKVLNRRNGRVCMKYFAQDRSSPNPATNCARIGAKLGGIENGQELEYIKQHVFAFFRQNGIQEGSIALGADRNSSCVSRICWHRYYFTWNDGLTDGLDMMLVQYWRPALNVKPGSNRCLTLVISTKNPGANGKLTDHPCTSYNNPVVNNGIFNNQGYICVRRLSP